MDAKNVDDLIVSDMQNKVEVVEIPKNDPVQQEPQDPPKEAAQVEEKPQVQPESEKADTGIDEYGNPVEKPKMYSDEEVQRIVRERLARERANKNTVQTETKPVKNEEIEEDWQKQLEEFVDKTIEKRESRYKEEQWRQQESRKQAEFEEKFNSGMGKYNDFHQVVAGKPITDSMLLATRTLENPAAFIYGACKLYPNELDRISKITDPYAQASEVGRLHERMVKNKDKNNNYKPMDIPNGDMQFKNQDNKINIDERIFQHAKEKLGRR